MPIYEYECGKCGHRLEAFQKMTDQPLTECPSCHNTSSLKKLISAAGFQLKGTGWYATDFRNKGKPETKSDTQNTAEKPAKTDDSSPKTSTTDKSD